jgi:hypothetical protein
VPAGDGATGHSFGLIQEEGDFKRKETFIVKAR